MASFAPKLITSDVISVHSHIVNLKAYNYHHKQCTIHLHGKAGDSKAPHHEENYKKEKRQRWHPTVQMIP